MTFTPGRAAPPVIASPIYFVTHGQGLVVRPDSSSPARIVLPGLGELEGVAPSTSEYIGRLDGRDAFAAELAPTVTLPAPFVSRNLRSLFTAVDEGTFAVAGRAVQISAWLATHRFCGKCGAATQRDPSERAMRCDSCDLPFYPRISPAIIVLVRRGEEALLARGVRFPLPMYSTLAGFSEPGESLEETLAREVYEEVGIRVKNPRYFGSQSWPFPNSLMLGFIADYDSGELRPDPAEIIDAQWFRADALPLVPPVGLSISRQLIDHWVGDVT